MAPMDSRNVGLLPQEPATRYRFYSALFVFLCLVVWFVWGGPFYSVAQDEQALVLTLGTYTKTTGPGLHFKWPWPVQTVVTETVTRVRSVEVGFRTIHPGRPGQPGRYREFKEDREMLKEAKMLTGDENIVNAELVTMYKISNLRDYYFNVEAQDDTVRILAEAVLRQVVADYGIDDALIRTRMEMEAEIRTKLIELAQLYGLGIGIEDVKLQQVQPPDDVSSAFKEVATAKEESQKLFNEAEGVRSEKTLQAKGEANRIVFAARGMAAERVNLATGETNRFLKLLEEYKKAPDVTRERLYQETLQRVMPKIKKVLVDPTAGILNVNRLENIAVPAVTATEGGR